MFNYETANESKPNTNTLVKILQVILGILMAIFHM